MDTNKAKSEKNDLGLVSRCHVRLDFYKFMAKSRGTRIGIGIGVPGITPEFLINFNKENAVLVRRFIKLVANAIAGNWGEPGRDETEYAYMGELQRRLAEILQP